MFLINQNALLIASPIATIIAALIGSILGSLGSFCIHKSKLKHDREQKDKDRKVQVKLDLLKKINVPKNEVLDIFNIINGTEFKKTVDLLINVWSELKENVEDAIVNDVKIDNNK